MPRSNRPRGRSGGRPAEDPDGLERLLAGWRRIETRRGAEWNVQPVSAVQAQKVYICPGCGRDIAPGTAHLVAWRADGVLGDAADLAARRHWHESCWRIA
ncbi:hypothetical protein [Leifsonia sp. SIMBA_070]|uniref:hypothetical protein n=1 Tax=Leifsonia sp. SIMBA_070 TaxID=3085810 RepID=UPI00397CC048